MRFGFVFCLVAGRAVFFPVFYIYVYIPFFRILSIFSKKGVISAIHYIIAYYIIAYKYMYIFFVGTAFFKKPAVYLSYLPLKMP